MKHYETEAPEEFEQYEFDIPPVDGHATVLRDEIDLEHYIEQKCPQCGRILAYFPDDLRGTVLVECRRCKGLAVLVAKPTMHIIGFVSDF